MSKINLSIILLLIIINITGCGQRNSVYHGYTFNDVQDLDSTLEDLQKKHATQSEVITLLGSPTFQEIIQNNDLERQVDFFYVEHVLNRKPLLADKILYTKVLILQFNYNGRLKNFSWKKTTVQPLFDSNDKTVINSYKMKFFEQITKNLAVANS